MDRFSRKIRTRVNDAQKRHNSLTVIRKAAHTAYLYKCISVH